MPLPNEIQSGRLNSILHKLLGITEGAPAPSLAPDLFSTLCLENDRPEWKFLGGERLCAGAIDLAAGGAGTYGTGVLWNPAGSGVLAVCNRSYNWDTGGNKKVGFRITSVDPSATYSTLTTYRMLVDTRWGTASTIKPACVLYKLATASPTGNPFLFAGLAAVQGHYDLDVVLAPGTGFVMTDTAANATFRAAFHWRERPLSRSEER